MRQIIGSADEFYRLRVVTVDESDAPDLEWREDVLYRRPLADGVSEAVRQRLEAVDLADAETAWTIGEFATTSEAHAAMREADLDLRGMTKSQFQNAYLRVDEPRGPVPPSSEHARTHDED